MPRASTCCTRRARARRICWSTRSTTSDDSLALVDRVREHFPDLPMIARARNVSHYFELRRRGVNVVERETFESALRTGRHALERSASIGSARGRWPMPSGATTSRP